MSAATDRNKRAMKRGAAVKPRSQPARAMGNKLDKALSKGNNKPHRSS